MEIYGNLSVKIGINQILKTETPYFLEKLNFALDLQTQCFLFNVQLLWGCDCSKWVVFKKDCILQWKILNLGLSCGG